MNYNTNILPTVNSFFPNQTNVTAAGSALINNAINAAMLLVRSFTSLAAFDDNGNYLAHVAVDIDDDGTTDLSLSDKFAAAVAAGIAHVLCMGEARDKLHAIQSRDFLAECKQLAISATAG